MVMVEIRWPRVVAMVAMNGRWPKVKGGYGGGEGSQSWWSSWWRRWSVANDL